MIHAASQLTIELVMENILCEEALQEFIDIRSEVLVIFSQDT